MRSFPGFDRLFWLQDPLDGQVVRAECDIRVRDPANRMLLLRKEAAHIQQLASAELGDDVGHVDLKLTQGRRLEDALWTTLVGPLLLHDRVVTALKDERLTGFSTYVVTLTWRRERVPAYQGLAVSGRCGRIDDSRGVWVEREGPGGRRERRLRGWFFDEDSWDGTDFFMSPGQVSIFVTERVKEAIEQLGVRNVTFEALDRVEVPEIIVRSTTHHVR